MSNLFIKLFIIMAAGYTAFITYLFTDSVSGVTEQGYGYSNAIHCNYINKIVFNDLVNKEFNIFFDNENDFKFLNSSGNGYYAHRLLVLAQLINNNPYDSLDDVKPNPSEWRIFDVTEQTSDYVSGSTLKPSNMSNTVFRVPISNYQLAPKYNLDYINYPPEGDVNSDLLSFGDETYFLGNVKTSVEAIAYTTDLKINLPLNQFNTSNNATWTEDSEQVYISEVGLYDENRNLVAIAKLNDPIPKDKSISRTLVFGIDF